VNPVANSCFWPRAFVALRPVPGPDAHRALQQWLSQQGNVLVSQQQDYMLVDITHLQSTAGSPHEIACNLLRLPGDNKAVSTVVGVAGDPVVASFAARNAGDSSIEAVAPWETRAYVADAELGQLLTPENRMVEELWRAGIRTGADLAAISERIVQHHFAEPGVTLWRACRGVSSATAPEVRCRYDGVHCRVVLPPRTSSLRSVSAHVRRISSAFLNALQRIQRQAQQIQFVIRIDEQAEKNANSIQLDMRDVRIPGLAHLLVNATKQNWSGSAVTHLELNAANLMAPGGQLDLFSSV
jgi:hypothetical protein